MKNVKKGKIESNNVSFLKQAALNLKALLVSPKTLEAMERSSLDEPIEVLYANQPLVNSGYLSEERPVKESTYIAPDAKLVNADSSNPLNRAVSRFAGFDVTSNTPIESSVSPINNIIPEVSIEHPQPFSQSNQSFEESIPQIKPISQFVNDENTATKTPDLVTAAIDYEVRRNPQEVRREVVEQPLQTPQEFEVHDNTRVQSNTAVVIERWREEFKKIVETEKNNQLRAVEDSSKKLMDAIDKGLNEISRANDASVEQKRTDMQAIKNTVISSQNPYEQQDYGNGIYGR